MIISAQAIQLFWVYFFSLCPPVIIVFLFLISSLIWFHVCELAFNFAIGNDILFFYVLNPKLFHGLYLVALNRVCHLSSMKLTVQITHCLVPPVSFLGFKKIEHFQALFRSRVFIIESAFCHMNTFSSPPTNKLGINVQISLPSGFLICLIGFFHYPVQY